MHVLISYLWSGSTKGSNQLIKLKHFLEMLSIVPICDEYLIVMILIRVI